MVTSGLTVPRDGIFAVQEGDELLHVRRSLRAALRPGRPDLPEGKRTGLRLGGSIGLRRPDRVTAITRATGVAWLIGFSDA